MLGKGFLNDKGGGDIVGVGCSRIGQKIKKNIVRTVFKSVIVYRE